jgi:hypothetical protein
MVISIHRVIDGRKSPQVSRFIYNSYYFLSAAVSPCIPEIPTDETPVTPAAWMVERLLQLPVATELARELLVAM